MVVLHKRTRDTENRRSTGGIPLLVLLQLRLRCVMLAAVIVVLCKAVCSVDWWCRVEAVDGAVPYLAMPYRSAVILC